MPTANAFDLAQLTIAFAEFQPDETFTALRPKPFVDVMADPEPEFVTPFIKVRTDQGSDRGTAIRDLYAFFLDRRYYLKLNLLYFAFDVFCSKVALPDAILDMTPLPHEDGAPLFKHKLQPGYKVE
jgi:hypothetical protein